MQIIIGREMLQAMRCFLILHFSPYSQIFFFPSQLVYKQLIVVAAIKHVFFFFLGCFSPPSLQNTVLTTRNWFLWRQRFKNGILVLSSTLWGNCSGNGQPNCTVLPFLANFIIAIYVTTWRHIEMMGNVCFAENWTKKKKKKSQTERVVSFKPTCRAIFVSRCCVLNTDTGSHTPPPTPLNKQLLFN